MGTKISYSTIKDNRRQQLKQQLDNFATFKWRGVDMYEKFGVFIINEKGGSLKIYNGANYSNDYSKPAYQSSNGSLMGVNFNIQTISFKIGVYWFTEEEYRRFIHFLNPYEINDLSFDFDTRFRYLVKLTGREDSVRYPQGRNEKNEMCYYTEMNLKFEIQGEPVARAQRPYEFNSTTQQEGREAKVKLEFQEVDSNTAFYNYDIINYNIIDNMRDDKILLSDLEMPLTTTINFTILEDDIMDNLHFELKAKYLYNNNEISERVLFNTTLKNLAWKIQNYDSSGESQQQDVAKNNTYSLTYDSEAGLLYFTTNDETKLLTLLTATYSGESIVETLNVYKFKIPGYFETPNFKYENLCFELRVSTDKLSDNRVLKNAIVVKMINEAFAITTLV